MDYRIAIPSIKRAKTLKEKTISYLAKTNINFNKIDLFLSDGDELPEYKKSLSEYPINYIVTNQKHINTQRNFIVNYYKENQLVLGIDDDIKNVEMKVDDKKTTTLLNLDEFVKNAFEICLSKKINLWGINPVLNPYFMKNTVSFDLKPIIACFYGWKNNFERKAFVSTNPEYAKEDYERSIRYYIADGGVGRFNYVAPNTKYYAGDGGIQTYRTVEYEEKAVQWLLNTFPHYCKRNTSKKSNFSEVRLRDSRIKKSL